MNMDNKSENLEASPERLQPKSTTLRLLGGFLFLDGLMLTLCLLTQVGGPNMRDKYFWMGSLLALILLLGGRKIYRIGKG